MDLTTVIDCTGASLAAVDPPAAALMAGYVTGVDGVAWTDAEFADHPGALRIDQWPAHTIAGTLADFIDVENGAVTIQDTPVRVELAQTAWHAGKRPGQRWPAVYVEESELTPVCNALNAAGLTENVPLFLTMPTSAENAAHIIQTASGPYPIIGVQYQFQTLFDVSLVSAEWLGNVSKSPQEITPNTTYPMQVEYYKPGFGWVLINTPNIPAAAQYRMRISDGEWTDWVGITL